MGLMTEMSLHDEELGLSKEEALRIHLVGNFYPPHPGYVVESAIAGFKKYWAGEIGLEELRAACYLREIDGLYSYFSTFLNEEDY